MIREYAPIPLIPAAWVMTFATMVYPGIDPYWIEHMHYFMVLFLAGFTILSWNEMDSPVLDIWRKIIGLGILFTGFGAASFTLTSYSTILSDSSLLYWLVAPGIGCYFSAQYMEDYVDNYRGIGFAGATSLLLILTGLASGIDAVLIAGFGLAVVSQTYSIIIAAKMDGNL